ncbi:hypothetical protein D3C72_2035990 [compost metagenome]
MRGTIGVTFHGDGGNGHDRCLGKQRLIGIVFRLARNQSEPPAIIVDGDIDMVGTVECAGGAVEGFVIELPGGRRRLPDETRKIMGMRGVTGTAAFGGEIELVPPGKLGLGRKWRAIGFLAANQVAADGH